MKRLLLVLIAVIGGTSAGAATLNPIQLLNPAGSTAGQAIISTGASTPPAWATVSVSAPIGTLPVANGGTGSTTAAAALTNLGAAPLTSPPLTGTPTAPTATVGTNSTQIATTAFVQLAVGGATTPNFQAVLPSNFAFTAGTPAKVTFSTENFDSSNAYDTTLARFTPLRAGKYRVHVAMYMQSAISGSSTAYAAYVYKNGTQISQSIASVGGTGTFADTVSTDAIISMNGTTDYLEGWGLISSGTSPVAVGSGGLFSYFEAYYIGP